MIELQSQKVVRCPESNSVECGPYTVKKGRIKDEKKVLALATSYKLSNRFRKIPKTPLYTPFHYFILKSFSRIYYAISTFLNP